VRKPTTILDYAPRIPPWQGLGSWLRWLFTERQLYPVEVAFGGWALFAVNYVLSATKLLTADASRVFMLSAMVTGSVAVLLASYRMLVARRFAMSLLLVIVALLSSLIGGIIQFERCPHATYVQIVGISIAVSGDACNNSRNITPWWMR
jgi:hypothetical protein